ncbi:hypothetical protein A3H85_01890 [Candidatus Daviesbacteria bacterium RIFCSPLOWO2_02_FULL_40_8]|uniref:Glutamyl-tRNA amidotransferase n=1 Tax=Candidatus Daviesbacteria bacterium RIFCSPLOWO2_01_FULL_40_24 TaxID=1797787 RepID=A0A1F5MJL4_9BACT|nr:MAG: hypothetical protein A2780_02695 [Candidatus Daviesbacteria bacterium RIFCSPHIGHO2_01_FULL_41_45]OGE35448.1 MAG: hypothetical protein A3C32_03270 [Candidatus Daviesbacteria bacterium RIFCSPHIGHO2_02_FULL_41_14]OGE65538.1 MAG: hypothetical protein A3B49_01850 [Candidatus Daviesbacteria bacterium RIFCSPLOWO2_01_FULL_40_24]OGE67100.1 MAG: hypothetical protein A3H85_01890 [Candidatus Daviesbacteria bacterium RIFCSPLOWO2_02_FULL_40_8]
MFDKLQQDLKQSILDKDDLKVSTLRLLLSEIYNAQIHKGSELVEVEIQSIIQKEVKKRAESVVAFRNGDREEMAKKEEKEADILKTYLPEPLSDMELDALIQEAITQTNASNMADMGKVIGLVMTKAGARVDGGRVSSLVREKLHG